MSDPDPGLDSLRQKLEPIINKTKRAWMGVRGQPGSVNLIIPGHDLWAPSTGWEMTCCLPRLRWLLGPSGG